MKERGMRMFDRFRIGVTLLVLAGALWVLPGLALLLPTAARWAAFAAVLLAEAFLLGVYMHDGVDLDGDLDEYDDEYELAYGAGRQA
jgi:hypothetical protein